MTFRLAVAAVGIAGLVLLLLPGIARGLGLEPDLAPWALTRRDDSTGNDERLLSVAGLRVAPDQLKANRRAWAAMSDSERAAYVARLDRLAQLDAEQRQKLVNNYTQWRELPLQDRERLIRLASALARFEASLGRQDQAVLDGLAGKDRARHLIRLWQARQQSN
jgi:hypothetical protein